MGLFSFLTFKIEAFISCVKLTLIYQTNDGQNIDNIFS